MKFTARIPVTAGLLIVLAATVGCNKLKSRDQLVKGVQAFKNSQYEQAVNHFQSAIALDPSDETSKLYLATAYAYQVVPNMTTPENIAVAEKAIDGFQKVLEICQRAVIGMHAVIVGNVIAPVAIGRGMDGRQPDRIHAQRADIVELEDQAGEITLPVAIAVAETADIDLINGCA